MAVTAATIKSDFDSGFLTPSMAGPIFEKAARISAIMQLAQQVPLGGNGVTVPVVTGRMAASWVDEAAAKSVSKGAVGLKTITPKKIAAIAVVSSEVVRANPGNYMNLLRPQIAEAFAIAFDYAATQDAGPDGTVGAGPFATNLSQGSKTVELGTATVANGGVRADLISAISQLVSNQDALGRTYRLNGWAFSPRAEPLLLGAVDTTGQPIFSRDAASFDSTLLGAGAEATRGVVLGRPAIIGDGVDYFSTLGWAGDWTQAAWGVVGGINYKVSTEASVTINGTLTSLFEHNLVAILAEAEYGFLVNDTAAFVELTDVQTS